MAAAWWEWRSWQTLVERGAGTLQRAPDRGFACFEHLGHLGGAEAEHLAQDERRALAGRQVLEACRERQPDSFSGLVARLGPRSTIREPCQQCVRVGVEP